jgi:hypothetical protein
MQTAGVKAKAEVEKEVEVEAQAGIRQTVILLHKNQSTMILSLSLATHQLQ